MYLAILSAVISGCATAPDRNDFDKRSGFKEIAVSTFDADRDYKVLGPVEAKAANILIFSPSIENLNDMLREAARKKYGDDVDAIINVRYTSLSLAQGILDLEIDKIAEGTAVRFEEKGGSAPLQETIASITGRHEEFDVIFTSDLHKVGADEQECELYGVKSDGSALRRITHNDYFEFHADVSPTRQEILTVTLFEKGTDQSGELDRESELVIWDFNGNLVKRLTDNRRPESVPHWSPDGEKIVFFAGKAVGNLNIYIIDRDGSNERQLTTGGYDVDPSFTPWGDVIFSRGNKIMIMDQDGGNLRALCSLDITPEDPVFIDSETIAFESKVGNAGNWGLGNYDIFLISKDGQNLRNITRNGFVDGMPQPVGNKIVFWRVTDNPGTLIMIMDKDGGNDRRLLEGISNSQMPTGNN